MPGYTRHNEIIILDSKPGDVEAHYFNVVQTALKRVKDQIRFKIPAFNHLDLILQEDAWIVVDRVLNDMPVAAWTNFQSKGRNNLHESVSCEIRIYHFAARIVFKTTLDTMEEILRQHLNKQDTAGSEKILSINNNEAVDNQ